MLSFATGVNFICCTGRIQPVGLNSNDYAMHYVRRHRSLAIELPCVPIEWLPTQCWRGAYCRSVYTQRRRCRARNDLKCDYLEKPVARLSTKEWQARRLGTTVLTGHRQKYCDVPASGHGLKRRRHRAADDSDPSSFGTPRSCP